jgi:hypothetical protein
MADAFPFLWVVPEGGLPWLGATPSAEETVGPPGAAPAPLEESFPARAYNPLHDRSGLFLTFAATPANPASLSHFLSRHAAGELRAATAAETRRPPARQPGPVETSPEEWLGQLWEMKRLVALWALYRRPDKAGLLHHIRWKQDDNERWYVEYNSRPDMHPDSPCPAVQEVIASPAVRPEWLKVFHPKDVFLPTLAYLQAKINEHLAGQTESGLLYDQDRQQLRLCQVPRTFLTALWLQFTQAVAEDKEYRQCGECGSWFEVSPEIARTNRRFCSNACRSRLYRRRQARAKELFAEGKSLQEIAAQLRSTVAAVKSWVGE